MDGLRRMLMQQRETIRVLHERVQAAQKGERDAVRALLDIGARVNAFCADGAVADDVTEAASVMTDDLYQEYRSKMDAPAPDLGSMVMRDPCCKQCSSPIVGMIQHTLRSGIEIDKAMPTVHPVCKSCYQATLDEMSS